MGSARAEWGTYSDWTGEQDVADARDALRLCTHIESADPNTGRLLVGFTNRLGHFFALGLGCEDSCAMYRESADPPYFQSKGSRDASERIDYAYAGQFTELPGTVRISREAAFEALKDFMETGQRPERIEWEET